MEERGVPFNNTCNYNYGRFTQARFNHQGSRTKAASFTARNNQNRTTCSPKCSVKSSCVQWACTTLFAWDCVCGSGTFGAIGF